ncbi:MAG: hypothetical protein U5R46_09095 [Gammaproteobacteria bacterium]|nr:hypothetical protein [Gammaproteobacteria bacterium]
MQRTLAFASDSPIRCAAENPNHRSIAVDRKPIAMTGSLGNHFIRIASKPGRCAVLTLLIESGSIHETDRVVPVAATDTSTIGGAF